MDDDATYPVFEAVLVAVIVLTALVFVSSLRTPSQAEGAGGIDFGRVAADDLSILQEREAEDDETYGSRLEEIVSLALEGTTAEAEAFMEDLLRDGTRYVLRINNGVGTITLLPQGEGPETHPRAARGAGVFLVPDWNVFADQTPAYTAEPGGPIGFDPAASTLTAPNGATTAPDGGSWADWWSSHRADAGYVPAEALYGVWQSGSTYFRVAAPDGTEAARPVYGIQLVVWYGA